MNFIPESTLNCSGCGASEKVMMPVDFCQYYYGCNGCKSLLKPKPKPGDCCVFSSYGDVACPPIQQGKTAVDD